MKSSAAPHTIADLVDAVRSLPRVLAVGARTKPRLSQVPEEFVLLPTLELRGILEYEPEEFTITALAGTPLAEIAAALAERGQYLPFDPMNLDAGSTLGGAVASGLSGPGRFRYGGVRDFILGIRFVDGLGRLLRLGGKVVKNAAGFDLPKFFVGSMGRFGVLAEITLKVFPKPTSTLTLQLPVENVGEAFQIFVQAANSRWEPHAVDLLPDGKNVCVRLGGPSSALDSIAREILLRWRGEILSAKDQEDLWSTLREFRWAHADGLLLKVVTTPKLLPSLRNFVDAVNGAKAHISAGGNMAFISVPSMIDSAAVDEQLRQDGLHALALRGSAPLFPGGQPETAIAGAVKKALDPESRFPSLGD